MYIHITKMKLEPSTNEMRVNGLVKKELLIHP
jgi:hypothetical protein